MLFMSYGATWRKPASTNPNSKEEAIPKSATNEERATVIKDHTAAVINLMREFGWTSLHIEREGGTVEIQVAASDYAPKPYVAATFNEPVQGEEL
jgi:hypothetical protein